jgi:hypothetical protein
MPSNLAALSHFEMNIQHNERLSEIGKFCQVWCYTCSQHSEDGYGRIWSSRPAWAAYQDLVSKNKGQAWWLTTTIQLLGRER